MKGGTTKGDIQFNDIKMFIEKTYTDKGKFPLKKKKRWVLFGHHLIDIFFFLFRNKKKR